MYPLINVFFKNIFELNNFIFYSIIYILKLYLFINILWQNYTPTSNKNEKTTKSKYFEENLDFDYGMFYKSQIMQSLYNKNYYFYRESLNSFIYKKKKIKKISYDFFIKYTARNKKNLFFYFFDPINWKKTHYVKTLLFGKFYNQKFWSRFKHPVEVEKNQGEYLVEDFFHITNYIKTWNIGFYTHNKNNLLIFKKYIFNPKSFKFFFNFYLFFKKILIAFCISSLFFMYSFFFFKFTFFKTTANWIIIILLIFWFFSTFNFFIKRYRYSKYTSAIQRFWKRAFMCFWLIEGFLFAIFFYYLLNASGEPSFMFDTFGFFVNHLLPIQPFLLNSFFIVLIINLIIFLLLNLKTTSLRKNINFLFFITIVLLYFLFTESYQFYYILNFYIEYIWIFSEEDSIWELDYDIPRTRNKNHYITLIIIAKFWHYIFIFISWIFFLMKVLEVKRIRYSFLSMNLQNIILFYIMNWLCLYSWFKWIFRRFMDQTYYWFFTSFRPLSITIIFNDVLNLFFNFFFMIKIKFKNTYNFNFFYLSEIFYSYEQPSFFKKVALLFLYF